MEILEETKAKWDQDSLEFFNDGSEPEEMPVDAGGARYRKRLALWLTRPDHPLTARVMVNRIWQGHFGRGIVPTANDFGRQGQPPTHPELLDWLADRIRGARLEHQVDASADHAFQYVPDVEPLFRRRKYTIDPDNVYLWRMNRRRLEAEAIWDSMHATAGTLNLKMSGRPVMPPLSQTEMAALRVKSWWVTPADPSEANRRAVYILSRRNFAFPMFDKFDRPDASSELPAKRDDHSRAPGIVDAKQFGILRAG